MRFLGYLGLLLIGVAATFSVLGVIIFLESKTKFETIPKGTSKLFYYDSKDSVVIYKKYYEDNKFVYVSCYLYSADLLTISSEVDSLMGFYINKTVNQDTTCYLTLECKNKQLLRELTKIK